jgi:hypothetical protein
VSDSAYDPPGDDSPSLRLSGRLDDLLSQLHLLYEAAAHASQRPSTIAFYLRRDVYEVLDRTRVRHGLEAWAAHQGLGARWYAADRTAFPQDIIKIAFVS